MESEPQARPTVAEIDGRALADNFAELGRIAGPAGVLPVVKSDAYGHGLALVGRVLRDAGAERFAVATAAEGRDLRAASVQGTIVVLGGVYPRRLRRPSSRRVWRRSCGTSRPRAVSPRRRAPPAGWSRCTSRSTPA